MEVRTSIISLVLLMTAQGVNAAVPEDNLRLIVKYKQPVLKRVALQKSISETTHLPLEAIKPMAGGAYSLVLKKSDESPEVILDRLRQDPHVLYAVKDKVGYFKPLPELPSTTEMLALSHELQWDEFKRPAGIMLESASGKNDGAWAYTRGEKQPPVVVAVLDTGVELNPSLVDNLLKDKNGQVWGWNFAGNNQHLNDETFSYHGTHVSGTIAAYGNVMQGVGEHLKVLTLKIPDRNGMFYESAVINAIYWAVGGEVPGIPNNPYPAQVLNMSFGVDEYPGKELDYCDEVLQDAISFARSKGAVIVVAAGNDNRDNYNAPAVCKGTLRIASTGPKGLRAYYSNYGEGVTFAAPGGDKRYGLRGAILSTVKPGYGFEQSGFDFYQGTSMASPHAAGVAALVYAASENTPSAEFVEKVLYATTHDFGKTDDADYSCLGRKSCGHGIVDAEQAVKAALANYDDIFSAPKYPLQSGNQQWVLMHNTAILAHVNQPKLTQDKSGHIVADYGDAKYELNLSQYKKCDLVGFDGVGCYY